MKVTKHSQMHSFKSGFGFFTDSSLEFKDVLGRRVVSSRNFSCDQFFAQRERLRNGCVDTSPRNYDSSDFTSHVSPVSSEKPWPSDTPNDVIFDSIIPKGISTPCEVSRLKDLKPQELDFNDTEQTEVDKTSDSVSES